METQLAEDSGVGKWAGKAYEGLHQVLKGRKDCQTWNKNFF